MTSISKLLLTARGPTRVAALARFTAGAVFVVVGVGKFVDHTSETAAFRTYGIPQPSMFVYAVGILEFTGGALLLAGVAVRLAAMVLAGNMVGAIATAGRVEGGPIHLGLAPVLLVTMLALLWTGAGAWSLDARLARR